MGDWSGDLGKIRSFVVPLTMPFIPKSAVTSQNKPSSGTVTCSYCSFPWEYVTLNGSWTFPVRLGFLVTCDVTYHPFLLSLPESNVSPSV